MATRSLECPNCGAPLAAGADDSATCAYCGTTVQIDRPAGRVAAAPVSGDSPHTRYLANSQAIKQIDARLEALLAKRAALVNRLNTETTIGCTGVVSFFVCWGMSFYSFENGLSACGNGDIGTGITLFVLTVLAFALPVGIQVQQRPERRRLKAELTAKIEAVTEEIARWRQQRDRMQAEIDEFVEPE